MKALDLFCGAGGVTEGLMRIGFDVVGVDVRAQPRYPGTFIEADVFDAAAANLFDIHDFDFVWASPPCQAFSISTPPGLRDSHVNLIPQTRKLLAPHPYTAIENVPNSPVRADFTITGPMVGLERIIRRRHIEVSWPTLTPAPVYKSFQQKRDNSNIITITKSLSTNTHFYKRKAQGLPGRVNPSEACEAMDITIPMTGREVGEAIPPRYAIMVAESAIRHMKQNSTGVERIKAKS